MVNWWVETGTLPQSEVKYLIIVIMKKKNIRPKNSIRFGIGLAWGGSRRGNSSTSLWTVVASLEDERPHWRWNNSLAYKKGPAVRNIGQWPQGRTSQLEGWKKTLDVCYIIYGKTLKERGWWRYLIFLK